MKAILFLSSIVLDSQSIAKVGITVMIIIGVIGLLFDIKYVIIKRK